LLQSGSLRKENRWKQTGGSLLGEVNILEELEHHNLGNLVGGNWRRLLEENVFVPLQRNVTCE